MPHPGIEHLKQRRQNRTGDTAVLWRELDLIIEIMEAVMGAVDDTSAAVQQLEADEAARDAAQDAALTDLAAEVDKLESEGKGSPELVAKLNALDATINAKKDALVAADPGAQAAAPTPPASTEAVSATTSVRSVYTYSGDVASIDTAQWLAPSPPVKTEGGEVLYWFAEDTAPGDAKGDGVGGVWHLYTGTVVPVAA